MFIKNKNNSNKKEFWIDMMEEKSSIIIDYIKRNKIISMKIYGETKIIQQKDFYIFSKKIKFKGKLSFDGNEYDLKIIDKDTEKVILLINFYYNLDCNLVVSLIDKDGRTEIITLPKALLS